MYYYSHLTIKHIAQQIIWSHVQNLRLCYPREDKTHKTAYCSALYCANPAWLRHRSIEHDISAGFPTPVTYPPHYRFRMIQVTATPVILNSANAHPSNTILPIRLDGSNIADKLSPQFIKTIILSDILFQRDAVNDVVLTDKREIYLVCNILHFLL